MPIPPPPPLDQIETFIARWQGREGGQERANLSLFITEFCTALALPSPEPAAATTDQNDYVFERRVDEPQPTGPPTARRIDLYKRAAFILEAKQSRQPGGRKALPEQLAIPTLAEPARRGTRATAARAWDVLMFNARKQAQDYARLLPANHPSPPFLLVLDVGHVIEIYADFTGQGRNYAQFPDNRTHRIYLEDLRTEPARARLRAIWTDPASLDPARTTARVTREISERLAAVSKSLETAGHAPEIAAQFLMRCLFTMFAEDVGLIPEKSFRDLLDRCRATPANFVPLVGQLWQAMDTGGFAYGIESQVRRFNGEFFKDRTVLPLGRAEIGELYQAASHDWREVEPSIFGTLLEQALNPAERRRLGAHYTPRAYVERLVVATIMEPLRADWANVLAAADRQKAENRAADAIATIRAFHDQLCKTRILDPACGTGNFLYVALELMKRLEAEVLDTLFSLGGQSILTGLEGHTIDPHQFLGLEINPRAAAIAELVLWIGYLQWHLRGPGGLPADPVLRAFQNIEVRDAVLQTPPPPTSRHPAPASRHPAPASRHPAPASRHPEGTEGPTLPPPPAGQFAPPTHEATKPRALPSTRQGAEPPGPSSPSPTPTRPTWPEAEFIVGNPPFIGGKDIRARMGDAYATALWAAHPDMNDSADFVMYWWDHAALILAAKRSKLRRFGFVTTNSITQVFQRRTIARHLAAKPPLALVMAIPDHPWTKATPDAAAVRIAMTVAGGRGGRNDGLLQLIAEESGLDTDTPWIVFTTQTGSVNADLTIGADLPSVQPLGANQGLCSRGVSLHGAGFIVTPPVAEHLGLGRRPGLEQHIRPYRNGRDLTAHSRQVMVIDLFGLSEDEVRSRYPEVYQHLLQAVRPARQAEFERTGTSDAAQYARNWWLFGKPRPELRPAISRLDRFIVTVETAKHRIFTFMAADTIPDNMLVAIGSDDAFHLGVLSSTIHTKWALQAGGWLGVGNDPRYSKTRCFDPFPFPAADDLQKTRIRRIAEDLDAHRKRVLADHPHLTLTGLYNVLEKLRAGTAPADLPPPDRRIFDDGLVLILKELHDRLDIAVAAAYGWPADLPEPELLTRLVALNHARAAEEAAGQIRWLRPDYQISRFGTTSEKLDLRGGQTAAIAATKTAKPNFPADDVAQAAAILSALFAAQSPLTPTALAVTFKQGRQALPRIEATLAALTRLGHLATQDGQTFTLRRAA